MMHSGLIFIGALIARTQALKGQNFPIPSEELYEDYKIKVDQECWTPRNSTRPDWKNCMNANELTVDYTCRFSLFGYKCFCCGAFFHYTEHGKICTKYCLLKNRREFCQPGLIVLPFNWGDPIPDKVTLDDAGLRRGPDGKITRGEETEVNVKEFEASNKCSSNPLQLHPDLGPGTLAPKEWEESGWGNETTARPEEGEEQGPIWQKSGEPRPRLPSKPKDWNDIVWTSSETKEGHKPQTTTTTANTTTTKPPSNHLGDSHIFGGGGTITTTTKPLVAKDRFGQKAQAWGSTQTEQEPSDTVERLTNIDKRVSEENRQEANVQETTRKSRPNKKKRTTKRPNQFGVGSNEFALVDSGGVELTTSAPTSTTTTTTEAEEQRPNWGKKPSSSRPSSSRPRVKESNTGSSGSTNDRQDDKPIWG